MAGGVWVPVNAQMKGFVATVIKEASGAAKKSGKAFEDEFSKSGQKAGQSLAKKVEAATNTLSRARSQEAQAAKELAVAEKELENLRSKGNASASQMIAAENKVATAKAKNEDASMRVARSEKDLEAARNGQSGTANSVKRAEDQLSQARIKSTDALGKVRAQEAAVDEARARVKASASAVQSAEQNLISVRDRYGAGTKQTAAAERELDKAKRDAERANVGMAKAEGDLGKARTNLQNATDQLKSKELLHKQAMKDVADAQKKAGETAKDAGDKTSVFSGKLGSLAKAASGAVAGFVGFSAIKNMAFDLGQQFAEMDRTIRAGTGASGAAFDGLAESARRVATEIPAADGDIKAIGSTLADLNTRLGATGPDLEVLTKQFTALSSLGFEADINAMSQALNGFGVEVKDMPAAMDDLFRVSQATGVSMDGLAQAVTKGGPQLRQFGFSLKESAALTGLLDKAGLDANKTLAGMGKSLVEFAKQGKKAPEALKETTQAVSDLLAKGDEAGAVDMAAKLFGTKGAPQFIDAVKTGAFSVDDLTKAIGATGDTILEVEGKTRTFKDMWNLFKQQAGVALEPLGKALMSVLIPAVELAADGMRVFADGVQAVGRFLSPLAPVVKGVAAGVAALAVAQGAYSAALKVHELGGAAAAFGKMATAVKTSTVATKAAAAAQWLFNSALLANPLTWVVVAIGAVVGALTWFFTKTETGRQMWAAFTEFMSQSWQRTVQFFKDGYTNYIKPVFDWIGEAWNGLKALFMEGDFTSSLSSAFGLEEDSPIVAGFLLLRDAATTAVDWVKQKWAELGPAMGQVYNTWIKPVVDAFKAGIDLLGQAITWWYQNVTKPALDLLGQAFQIVWNTFVKPAIDGFRTGAQLLGQVIGIAINGTIVPAWQFLGSMIQSVWNNIVMPVWDLMKNAVGVLADFLTGNFQNIGNRFGSMGEAIKGIVYGVIQVAMDFFKGLVEQVGNAWQTFQQVVQTVVETVKRKIQEMGDRLAAFPGQVKSLFAQAGQWLVSSGRSIINGLWEGMKAAWGSVKSWLSSHLSFSAIGSLIGLRGGGIVAYADGGITQYVQGGINQLEAYANGGGRENHRAQIAPAGAWRVFAEPETGGEAYIPLASSKRGRSTAILDEVANRFGYMLVDAKTGREYAGGYRGDLGPQDVRAFADGGIRSPEDYLNFAHGQSVGGEKASGSLEGWRYENYPSDPNAWGDCSYTQGKFAAFTVGISTAGRKFATGSEASWLSSHGFLRGRGQEGDYRIGFKNGGPGGGHTSGTLPDGTNVEMGGGRGNGQIGGRAAGAWDSYYNEFFYMPVGPQFEKVELDDLGDLGPDSPAKLGADATASNVTVTKPVDATPATQPSTSTDTGSSETSISGMLGDVAKEAVSGQVSDILSVFGVPDKLPSWMTAARDAYKQNTQDADNPGTSVAEQHAIETHDHAVTTMTPQEIKADPQLKGMDEMDTIKEPKVPEWGPDFFAYEIARAAKDMGISAKGAQIGVGVALVESGDPMKMYANNSVPESLKFKHDAVGSDHDSVGLFQQRNNGAWGTVAQRMNPYESAKLFFNAMLSQFPDYEAQDRGDVAQGIQRSAFPSRYDGKMSRALDMVNATGLYADKAKSTAAPQDAVKPEAAVYDQGGVLKHGMAGFNFSKKPEAVLTNEQWKQLEGLASSLDPANLRSRAPEMVSGLVSSGVKAGSGVLVNGAKAGLGAAGSAASAVVPGAGALVDSATGLLDTVAEPVADMAAWYAGEVAAGWTDAFMQFGEQGVSLVTEPIEDVLGPLSSAVNTVSSRVGDVPVGGSNSTSQGEQVDSGRRGPTTVINVQSVAEALEAQRHIERRELAGFGVGR